jgi:hypothetical protein
MGEYYSGKSYWKNGAGEFGKEYILKLNYDTGGKEHLVFEKDEGDPSGNGSHNLYFKKVSGSAGNKLEQPYTLDKDRDEHDNGGKYHKTYVFVNKKRKDSMKTGAAGHSFVPDEEKEQN